MTETDFEDAEVEPDLIFLVARAGDRVEDIILKTVR
ncbi:MAG: hypothetical protein ACJAQT_003765 [Akkermansiaceae bacterium]|jgi:hypothetical protein